MDTTIGLGCVLAPQDLRGQNAADVT